MGPFCALCIQSRYLHHHRGDTGADTARRMTGIPPSAIFFSFSYPCEHSQQHRSNLAGQLNDTRAPTHSRYSARIGHNNKDFFVLFLCNGGFVYFDSSKEICGIEAVTWDSGKEVTTHLNATRSSSAVFFAQHSVISEDVVEHLTQCGRWWPVTLDEVGKTYSHFAWICPCEAVAFDHADRWCKKSPGRGIRGVWGGRLVTRQSF
jgi:hypothetical protein